MPASKWQREWWAACLVGLLLLQRLEDLERLLLGRETAHLGDCSRAICRANRVGSGRVGNRGGRGELRQVAGSQKLRSWWWVMVVSGEPGRSRSIHGVPSAECGQYLAPLARCSLVFSTWLAPRPRPTQIAGPALKGACALKKGSSKLQARSGFDTPRKQIISPPPTTKQPPAMGTAKPP